MGWGGRVGGSGVMGAGLVGGWELGNVTGPPVGEGVIADSFIPTPYSFSARGLFLVSGPLPWVLVHAGLGLLVWFSIG